MSVVFISIVYEWCRLASREKILTQYWKDDLSSDYAAFALRLNSARSRVGAFVEGASSAGTNRVTPERA